MMLSITNLYKGKMKCPLICLLALVLLYVVESSSACAPYFRTKEWFKKHFHFNSSKTCSQFVENTTQNVNATGAYFCSSIFAGKVFCSLKCNEEFNAEEKVLHLLNINCPQFTIRNGTGGNSSEELSFSCRCYFQKPDGTELEGNTSENTWKNVEDTFLKHCPMAHHNHTKIRRSDRSSVQAQEQSQSQFQQVLKRQQNKRGDDDDEDDDDEDYD